MKFKRYLLSQEEDDKQFQEWFLGDLSMEEVKAIEDAGIDYDEKTRDDDSDGKFMLVFKDQGEYDKALDVIDGDD